MFVNLLTTPKDRFAIRVQNYNYLFEWKNVSVPYFLKYMHFLLVLWRRFLRNGVCNRVVENHSWLIQKYLGHNLKYVRHNFGDNIEAISCLWLLNVYSRRWRRHRSVTGACALAYPRYWTRENRTLEGCPNKWEPGYWGTHSGGASPRLMARGIRFAQTPRLLSGDAFSVIDD